ncbi:MAG: zinc-dependent alcohol dehydrogenase [Acidimicrobiales bacterium]
MRAVRNTDAGIEVVDVAPVEPGDGLVRVRVRSSGICGSDLHLIEWGPMPVTLGHEFAGLLDDGTEVAVQPQTPCLECDLCRAGDDHLCRTLLSRTHGVSIDGGLADEVLVDPRAVIPLPPGVSLDDAGLVEPLAVAVHAAHLAPIEAGQRVLVIGGGSIGLSAVAALLHRGVAPDLFARHAHQVEAGARLGGAATLGADYDVVVDAAGSQAAVDQAFELVRPGGTVVAMATYWAPVQVGLAMTTKEVRFVASSGYGHHHGAREFAVAADLLAAVPELPDALVTHRFGLDDAPEAFRVAGDRAAGAIKVQLSP